jgi:hypothetical protein
VATKHYLGDTTPVTGTYTNADGTPYNLPGGSTIKISVRKELPDGTAQLIAGPFTGTFSGNVASASVVTAHTDAIRPGTYYLEWEVTTSGAKSTRVPRTPFQILQGTIS